ncbi:MAG TPA: BON domain-containing protein [Thermomicrobiaceae bacterium]|nr:BON domain-containing protein [Thermomicrobiaceae bacterium]
MTVHGPSRRTGYDYGMTGSYSYGKHGNYDYGAFLPHYDQPIHQVPTWQFGRPYTPSTATAQGPQSGKGPRRADARIQEDVSEQLHNHAWLDARDIEVRVNQGEVTLTGSVATRQDKRLAEKLADSVPGVIDVHNRLAIQTGQESRG